MAKPTFLAKRIIVGVTLLVAITSLLNYTLNWRLFGLWDEKVMIGCYVVLFLVMLKWLPSRAEWDEHRNRKDGSS